jgi:hypothetical protein
MNERIKKLAEQAGWSGIYTQWVSPTEQESLTVPVTPEQIERFAELVRQDERELCAKAMQPMLRDMISRGQAVEIIRARGEK